ncbi:MAG: EpsG family protein [Candidatus Beckwithbacteria bacterium]
MMVIVLILIYLGINLSLINWGLPGLDRVFCYHMDEWHQFKAIVGLWQQGSNNIPGAANGVSGHFILSGLYLAPFVFLGIIKPALMTAISNLEMQQRLFEILRLNTLIFGLGSILCLKQILSKHFKVKPVVGLAMLIGSPVFLISSNYFKYDIALVFWILLSLKLILDQRLIWAALAVGLALATKISALPLLGIYLLAFYKKKLVPGGLVILFIFLILGIPDVWLKTADLAQYREFLTSNLITNPQISPGLNLGLDWLLNLGLGLILGFGYWLVSLRKNSLNKNQQLVLLGLILFVISLIPLRLQAVGNRLLVLAPFLAILVGQIKNKIIIYGLVVLQLISGIYLILPKWQTDPRVKASKWIEANLPKGTIIGLENIPIYQYLPDIILKDYYLQEYGSDQEKLYEYVLINDWSESPPDIVIITKVTQALIDRLARKGYQAAIVFNTKSIEINHIPNQIAVYIKK